MKIGHRLLRFRVTVRQDSGMAYITSCDGVTVATVNRDSGVEIDSKDLEGFGLRVRNIDGLQVEIEVTA